jgi:hypothetical protein
MRCERRLFTDYAEKQRFLYLPPGEKFGVGADGRLQFPVGSALIKSFGYHDASGKLNIIETRLLLHRAEGWVALPYVWNADGSDAVLKVGGARKPVEFSKPDGTKMAISYSVPNKNQCKQCHSTKDSVMPVGPVWQNLSFANAKARLAFEARGAAPAKLAAPEEAKWDDPKSGPLEARHWPICGSIAGIATSRPGRPPIPDCSTTTMNAIRPRLASANAQWQRAGDRAISNFVIEPGHPERSILIYRMKSTDPGIAMPELGRATAHDEGVALLEAWIKSLPTS